MQSFLVLCLASAVLCYEPTFKMPDVVPMAAKGRYIVKYKNKSGMVKASSFIKAQAAQASPATLASISSDQGVQLEEFTYGVASSYNSTFMSAAVVNLSEDDMSKLKKRHDDDIEYIEPDQFGYGGGSQQGAPWGLARVGRWGPGNGNQYDYPDAAGQGVDVYVLDTGLMTSHPSFGGRAKFVKNYVRGYGDNDVVGHGTHVAGTIGSSIYGVAKKANIYGLKVLGDNNRGDYSGMIEAIQYVATQAKPGKTAINMSIYGGISRAMSDALAAARKAGVVTAVCAGNDSKDACGYSPADSPHALTVGATDQNDNIAKFSNFGKCVDIYAPGVSVNSLSNKVSDGVSTMQGTSMATPHVVGVAALYMSMKSYKSADDVVKDILGWSRRCVKGTSQGSGTGMVYANPSLK